MGGRGGASGFTWQRQLRQMAKQGRVPNFIMGDGPQRSQVFTEINKLYDMPQTNATIVDQGNAVWVNFGGSVSRVSYPSGVSASAEEKSGVLKWLLLKKKQE